MAHQEESADSEEKKNVDDAEPVSMRDLEMIFAPGKPPPMLHREPEAPPHVAAPVHREVPKPPRPPRHNAAPRDMSGHDLSAFAALGSIPAPPIDGAETRAAAPPPPPETEKVEAKRTDSSPPESKRMKARVLPRLRKPLPLPFPEPKKPHEEWNTPPDGVLQDLKSLTSSYPPPPKRDSVEMDDLLGMKNDALGGALSAPIMPPDLARMLNEPSSIVPTETSRDSALPAKKKNGSEAAAAVTAPPNDPKKKKKKGSSTAPASGSVASGPTSQRKTSTTTRPSAPAPAKVEPRSRTPIYALLAAALLGGGYFVLRGPSAADEPAKREPPKPATTTETRPAQATPQPVETVAAPMPTSEPVVTAAPTVASTATSPTPTGNLPVASTGAPATTSAPALKPTATPAATGTDFDKAAASSALGGAMGQAAGCKQSGDPSGVARVQVTFAPSGRVTVANISGPPFAGTATGGCIARAFKTANVPPFAGDPVTVSKTVQIP